MAGITFHPQQRDGGYLSWSLPSAGWSNAEWSEDTIKLFLAPDGEAYGHTEFDQCDKRDLDQDNIAQIVAEFGLSDYFARSQVAA